MLIFNPIITYNIPRTYSNYNVVKFKLKYYLNKWIIIYIAIEKLSRQKKITFMSCILNKLL